MKVKLSIIIANYNWEKYLPKCLKSVCEQYQKDIEIIVIDDCSSDSSCKILRKFKKRYNFITVIYLKKNSGVSNCRNIGIKYSKGEYLYFIDSDDELTKRSIKNILYQLYKYSEKELFILNYFKAEKEKKYIFIQNENFNLKKIKSHNNKTSLISYYKKKPSVGDPPILASWQFIFKKSFLKSNNLYYKNIFTSEDWEFIPKVLCLVKNFKTIKKPTYIWKVSDTSSLGKKIGYLTAVSCIHIMYWMGKFIMEKKNVLKKKDINALMNVFDYTNKKFLLNILSLDLQNISRLSKYLFKFRIFFKKLTFLKAIKFNYLLNSEKNVKRILIKYKYKKNILIKNVLKKVGQKKIIIFCAGSYTEIISKMFFDNGIVIKYIVDNNTNYTGQKINNILILAPSYLKRNINKFLSYQILICNKNTHDVKNINQQLRKLGFYQKNISSLMNI